MNLSRCFQVQEQVEEDRNGYRSSKVFRQRLAPLLSARSLCGSFRKWGVPYFGVLIMRILLFRVLY